MKEIIANFSKQILKAIEIGENSDFQPTDKKINAVLVCGLGGSGIGGKIVSLLVAKELKVPFLTVNDYEIPAWVDENTLVIASSYSGNTEETLAALEMCVKRGAEIAAITSCGTLADMAKTNGWNVHLIPGGEQPRAMLAYSLVQQIFLLQKYGLISDKTGQQLKNVPQMIDDLEERIRMKAVTLAKNVYNKTVIIYAGPLFEGVAVRFRQQINENSKELCWHHILPEMNHNELVGWGGGDASIGVIIFRNDSDHERTKVRMDLSRGIYNKYTDTVLEVMSKGNSNVERAFYHILLGDWISIHMAEANNVDPIEIKVIDFLKSELGKI